MDEEARRLRRIGSIKEIGFRRWWNETILPSSMFGIPNKVPPKHQALKCSEAELLKIAAYLK